MLYMSCAIEVKTVICLAFFLTQVDNGLSNSSELKCNFSGNFLAMIKVSRDWCVS